LDNITTPFAFVAGLISFFSPCIFPLIPVYVANLTGSYITDNKLNVTKTVLMVRSISFIAGFSFIFMVMGASASLIGHLFIKNKDIIEKLGGILIIIFGLQMAGVLNVGFLMRETRFQLNPNKESSIWRSVILGIVFGAGWTPCVGLTLSSILLLAGSSATMNRGIFLLFIYSLGLGIPFLIVSLIITRSLAFIRRINRVLGIISVISGFVLVAMGVLLFTGQLQQISAWLAAFTYSNY
jgi:cytochrome c-type biogenesis protein